MLSEFATRLTGSDDLYATAGYGAASGVNYLASHDGATVRDLIGRLGERFPELREKLDDGAGGLARHTHVFVDGRGVRWLPDGLDTVLRADQRVEVFPAVAGG